MGINGNDEAEAMVGMALEVISVLAIDMVDSGAVAFVMILYVRWHMHGGFKFLGHVRS